jgi:hypothetical protein
MEGPIKQQTSTGPAQTETGDGTLTGRTEWADDRGKNICAEPGKRFSRATSTAPATDAVGIRHSHRVPRLGRRKTSKGSGLSRCTSGSGQPVGLLRCLIAISYGMPRNSLVRLVRQDARFPELLSESPVAHCHTGVDVVYQNVEYVQPAVPNDSESTSDSVVPQGNMFKGHLHRRTGRQGDSGFNRSC